MRFLLITAVFLQSAAAAAPALAMNSTKFIRTAAGDPQDSVDTLRMKAERGDREAEYKLALAYDVGIGAPQDLEQAAAWYERAAEQGHAGAQFSLGLMYGNGRGVPQDLVRAHGGSISLPLPRSLEPAASAI